MKKLLYSLVGAGIVSAVIIGASLAFFSDEETSTGNTFQAGAVDLKVSDTCHYYQNDVDVACPTEVDPSGAPITVSNWQATDLVGGYHKFFNFKDLKPGDYGENTVDFTVVDNPAWMCANITVTSDADVDYSEPELAADLDKTTGELDKYLEIFWWVDDGDNIYETGEKVLYGGERTLEAWLALGINNTLPLTFADSYLNWTTWPAPQPNTLPIPANTPQYLGIGWCFGDLVITGTGTTGFTCTGVGNQNDAQTDSITADLTFNVEQYRNNASFKCPENQNR